MIELSWKKTCEEYDYDVLKNITNLIAWLTTTLAIDEKNHDIILRGYITVVDEKSHEVDILLLCNGEHQTRILHLLQQPPEEYKGKYSPKMLSDEPNPVHEVRVEDDDEEDTGVLEKT